MPTALRIDTLSFSKRLKEAGADENLANAIVEGLTGADTSELATKTDIDDVRADLKADIADVRADLKAEIADVRTDLKAEITDVRAVLKQEIADVRADLKADIADVKSDVKWIKIIGAAIIAALILPKLTELL